MRIDDITVLLILCSGTVINLVTHQLGVNALATVATETTSLILGQVKVKTPVTCTIPISAGPVCKEPSVEPQRIGSGSIHEGNQSLRETQVVNLPGFIFTGIQNLTEAVPEK